MEETEDLSKLQVKNYKKNNQVDLNQLATPRHLPKQLNRRNKMAYLGYKNKAFREYKREQERVKQWKEVEKIRKKKAKKTKKILKAIAAHVFIAIVLITIYYLL